MSEEFLKESNRIEGIHREPTDAEMEEFHRFMGLDAVNIDELNIFVSIYQPDAVLRSEPGLDVRVGGWIAPRGSVAIKTRLMDMLSDANQARANKYHVDDAYTIHARYEKLHPFTDCNGRSGRMLWMWMMKEAPLGFLHTWYYQSLSHMDRKVQ